MPNPPHQLVLASQSPRRKQLLQAAGYSFAICVPDESAESGSTDGKTPGELVAHWAFRKAENVASGFNTGIILACDTVAECDGIVLGKPADRDHARQMLRKMSGRDHRVLSGVCLWQRPSDTTLIRVEETELRMDRLSDTAIETYLDTGGWVGKAGAFGFQDGLDWVHIVQGSESNVVGLPMELLTQMFCEIDFKP